MTKWLDEVPVATCPTCGADCAPWRPQSIDLDWWDDDEREAGYLAHALIAHRYDVHRVEVAVGDLVRYWAPWRGRILGSEVYTVAGMRDADAHDFARRMGADAAPLLGMSYYLTDPHRPNDHGRACWPFVGDPERPIVFEVVSAAPPVEVDLLDLLGWVDA